MPDDEQDDAKAAHDTVERVTGALLDPEEFEGGAELAAKLADIRGEKPHRLVGYGPQGVIYLPNSAE